MTLIAAKRKPKVPLVEARKTFTRGHICDAAKELFFVQGYAGPTMEEIAHAAGIKRSTLYTHFRDKEEILVGITQDYTAKLKHVVARLPGPVPTRKQVDSWIADFASFVTEQRGPSEFLVTSSNVGHIPEPVRKFGVDFVEMLAAQVPAFRNAMDPSEGLAHAWAMTTLRELGWALCFYAQNGEIQESRDRLEVAAVLFTRFVQGKF